MALDKRSGIDRQRLKRYGWWGGEETLAQSVHSSVSAWSNMVLFKINIRRCIPLKVAPNKGGQDRSVICSRF
jgi:hypothetical protein